MFSPQYSIKIGRPFGLLRFWILLIRKRLGVPRPTRCEITGDGVFSCFWTSCCPFLRIQNPMIPLLFLPLFLPAAVPWILLFVGFAENYDFFFQPVPLNVD